jgi:hypothetical protein
MMPSHELAFLDEVKLKLVQFNLVPGAWIRHRLRQDLNRWERERVAPFPHLLKQHVVREYARHSGAAVFIETGTYYGAMLEACLELFEALISFEIEGHFHERAQRRFGKNPKVTLVHGDSGELLPAILQQIDRPCLFWLDAHYSCGLTGRSALETPVRRELEAILGHRQRHTILIDDANAFDGSHDYPEISWIESAGRSAGYRASVSQNIIRLVAAPDPRRESQLKASKAQTNS